MPEIRGLTAINLENFKSIKKARISLPGLSILLGANSAGKSSVLQATLLFLQNIANSRGQNISMNGPLIRLGADADVMSNNQIGTCRIGLETRHGSMHVGFHDPVGTSTRIVTEFSFEHEEFGSLHFSEVTSDSAKVQGRLVQPIGRTQEVDVRFLDVPRGSSVSLNSLGGWLEIVEELFDGEYSNTAEIQLAEDPDDPFDLKSLPDEEVKVTLRRASDFAILHFKKGAEEEIGELVEKHQGVLDTKALIIGFLAAEQFDLLFDSTTINEAISKGDSVPLIKEFLQSYKVTGDNLSVLDSSKVNEAIWESGRVPVDWRNKVQASVLYLGPLRSGPLVGQRNDSEALGIAPLGLSGELAVKAIEARLQASDKHTYPLPAKVNSLKYPITQDLELALSAWAKYLGLGSKLSWHDQGLRGFDFLLDGKRYDQLGTGVSQTIPVIIISLLCRPGQLVMLEQPELHLHPDAQQKLLDFFLACVSTGRKILFETHSEYMVNRLRRQALAGLVQPDQVSLNFVEKNKAGVSLVHEAELAGSGGFTYWPKGFFGQIEDDLLAILESTPD